MAKVTAVGACCGDECHVLGSERGGDENKKQVANEGCVKNTTHGLGFVVRILLIANRFVTVIA